MIYCQLIADSNAVGLIHYKPFDEIHGLHRTESELKENGFFVDTVPDAESVEGKNPILKVNLETMQLYYEYVDRPLSVDEKIVLLSKENEELRQAQTATQSALDFILLSGGAV